MSTALPPKPRTVASRRRVCVVASQYNEQFTDALLDNAVDELSELFPQSSIEIARVSGAFEIPVVVKTLAQTNAPDCIIALGVIIRGDTQHADLVASSVTDALQQIAVTEGVPVIHEVLLVDDEKQAFSRCIGESKNRGREAAQAALSVVEVMKELKRPLSRKAARHANS